MKQNKQRSLWRGRGKRFWLISGLLILAVVSQVLINGFLLTRSVNQPPDQRITEMIIDSVRALGKPAVVQPVAKRVYLPEANLVLPFYPEGIPEIRYSYSPDDNKTGASLYVTTPQALQSSVSRLRNAAAVTEASYIPFNPFGAQNRSISRVFEEVPVLQACSRGFEIIVGRAEAASTAAAMKRIDARHLADGRTATIYRDTGCPSQPEAMTEYLRQVQSY